MDILLPPLLYILVFLIEGLQTVCLLMLILKDISTSDLTGLGLIVLLQSLYHLSGEVVEGVA